MQVAYFTPYLVWPADTGGKLRSFYLLRGLAREHEVDLYATSYVEIDEYGPLTSFCRSVTILPLQHDAATARLRNLLASRTPRSVSYFRTEESLRAGQRALERGYDLAVSDEIVMAPYVLDNPAIESKF